MIGATNQTPSDRSNTSLWNNLEQQTLHWDGGDNIWTGEHDDFCYVCGGTLELFPCQTCSTSYHADCMLGSITSEDISDFWFCPHCVDKELHVPMAPSETVEPVVTTNHHHHFSRTLDTESVDPPKDIFHTGQKHPLQERTPEDSVHGSSNGGQDGLRTQDGVGISSQTDALPGNTFKQTSELNSRAVKGSSGNQRKSFSPPRKRSKYSSFSSSVDKALAVIHKELEKAAEVGKTEDGLQHQIQTLEQQLKLKDGQVMLLEKELLMLKQTNGDSFNLRQTNTELRMQIEAMRQSLQDKDQELNNWRTRLEALLCRNSA